MVAQKRVANGIADAQALFMAAALISGYTDFSATLSIFKTIAGWCMKR